MWYTVNVPWSVLHSAAVECHDVKLLHFLSAVWRFCGISFKFSKVVHLKTIPIPTNSIDYAQLQVRDAKKNDIAGVYFQKICFLLKNFVTHHLIKFFWNGSSAIKKILWNNPLMLFTVHLFKDYQRSVGIFWYFLIL